MSGPNPALYGGETVLRVAIVKNVGKAIKRIAGTLEKVLEELAGVLVPPPQAPAPVPVRVRIDQ